MHTFEDPVAARRFCATARAQGGGIGLVPTMGALHEGHLELVRRASAETELSCVSIFVNPLQFDDPSDLARYPRDFDADVLLLERAGCGMVFTGTLMEFFPEHSSPEGIPRRDPGPFARGLEGERRPGHFAGVATIVARLFEWVAPEVAYFGEKDYQQSLVVGDLARRANGPRIAVVPTSRDPDGLARSSRNQLLTEEERERALAIPRALFAVRELWKGGERRGAELRHALRGRLEGCGLLVEYAAVLDPRRFEDLVPDGPLERARALVAASCGAVRLIDTLALDGDEPGS